MIHANDVRYHLITCALCGRPFYGHRRDTGECMTWQRAAVKPLQYTVAREQPAAKGWRLR